jgi:hypothetical protein
MVIKYRATMVLSKRGNAKTRMPATREIRGVMLR